MTATSWRNLIKVHPAADLFPMMSESELKELAADIKANGLRIGVTVWTPDTWEDIAARGRQKKSRKPQEVLLLDGRNRLSALEMAYERAVAEGVYGDDEGELDDVICDALETDPRYSEQKSATLLYGDVDPYDYVISANIHRRHLNESQRAMVAAKIATMRQGERTDLSPNGEKSISQQDAADLLNVSKRSVERARTVIDEGAPNIVTAVERGEISVSAAAKAIKLRSATTPSTPASQSRDKAVAGFSHLLHLQPEKTLSDLGMMLKGACGRISEIPLPKRIVWARTYLDVLGVGIDDLRNGATR